MVGEPMKAGPDKMVEVVCITITEAGALEDLRPRD
jgi:hypothetical protein